MHPMGSNLLLMEAVAERGVDVLTSGKRKRLKSGRVRRRISYGL